MRTSPLFAAFALLALAGCGSTSTGGSSSSLLTPGNAQALACWGQAAANVSTAVLTATGDPSGAAISSASSAALGVPCNGGAPSATNAVPVSAAAK